MKFLIAGAGAIGAYIGAKLAQKGQDVVLFARGPHFRAMKEHGVRVQARMGISWYIRRWSTISKRPAPRISSSWA